MGVDAEAGGVEVEGFAFGRAGGGERLGEAGHRHPVDDPAARQIANAGTSFPRDERVVLFELEVTSAFSTVFGLDGQPVRQRWRATDGT